MRMSFDLWIFLMIIVLFFGVAGIYGWFMAEAQYHEYVLEHATQIKAQLVNVSFKSSADGKSYTLLTFAFNNTTMQIALDGYQTSYAEHIGDYYIIKIYRGQVVAIEQVEAGAVRE